MDWIPKTQWDGLVYIHGVLNAHRTESNLNSLVLSSGDFGLAYLTERWAARFVTELLRNYTVCFIGYSIEDRVLRYMMDAHAADQEMGASRPEMFAFGPYVTGKEAEADNEWRTKKVTPILYCKDHGHDPLHDTLHAWAGIYRDGVRGKEQIVTEGARTGPQASTKEDDFVGRVLWALSDRTGAPARVFAEMDPVPSLEWLEPLARTDFGHFDLARFGVTPDKKVNRKLAFSLIARPSPFEPKPWMTLVSGGSGGRPWDNVMWNIARWLIRHLDDPNLLLWLVKQGGQLHSELIEHIRRTMDGLAKLESAGKTEKLEDIRAKAPNAIPRPAMRKLWDLVLTGRAKSAEDDRGLYQWRERFSRDGLTTSLRLELREKLTPRVALSEPFDWPTDDEEGAGEDRIRNLVEPRIELSAQSVHWALQELPQNEAWRKALGDLLPDFNALLVDALDLMREVGGIDEKNDLSYVHQPSISQHPQNHALQDWTALIDLTRDAWLAVAHQSPERARLAAEGWRHMPYALFRRLAFFAAAHREVIPHRVGLDWLLADDGWWLWSIETTRESYRLMVALAPGFERTDLKRLEAAILGGPPRAMYREDLEPEFWTSIYDNEIWLRLAKIDQSGAELSADAKKRLIELSDRYREWKLADDERDEFPGWVGEWRELEEVVPTPRRRRELVQWIKEHEESGYPREDDWQQRCRDDFPTTACTLCALSRDGQWPRSRWQAALQAWSEEKLIKRSWRYMGPILSKAPVELLQALSSTVGFWLREVANAFEGDEKTLLMFCDRVLTLEYEVEPASDDVLTRAINHPVGRVTEALVRWWYGRTLADRQGLPSEIKATFTKICNPQFETFRHGRVVLAIRVLTLFRVDPDWTTEHLLPLFDWERSNVEARAAWKGYLHAPRLYRPLMEALKPAFLETAQHYDALGQHGRQYSAVLVYAALDPADVFENEELADATRELPQEALHEAAGTLIRALDGAGDQRKEYWTNRVEPYLRNIWPKTSDRASSAIAEHFCRVCIAAREAFPIALEFIYPWLRALEQPDHIVDLLHEKEICRKFPHAALKLLDAIIDGTTQWAPRDLKECLEDIRNAEGGLENDPRFQRLRK